MFTPGESFKGKILLSTATRSILGIAVAAVALALAAGPTEAAAHSCTRSGLSVESQTATNVVLRRVDFGGAFEGGNVTHRYVCSRRYGKIVSIGSTEETRDGGLWATPRAMNARYAAVVYGGDDDGAKDSDLEVIDLKTGKTVTRSDPTGYIEAVALNRSGAVGWTLLYADDGASVHVRDATGKKRPRQLAAGPTVDPEYLRWSSDGKKLIWTDDMTVMEYWPRRFWEADAGPKRSCIRPGDRILGREYDSDPIAIVSRPFAAPGWSNGRLLIACASERYRRVVIARSGSYKGERYTVDKFTATRVFAAVAVTRARGDRKRTSITTIDLSRQRRVCAANALSAPGAAKVGAIALSWTGTTAWTVTKTSSGKRSVRFCDSGGPRTVFEGPTLDPSFLNFEDAGHRLWFVTDWKSGKP